MAETTTTTQYVREAPDIEAYKLGLYQDAQKIHTRSATTRHTAASARHRGFYLRATCCGDVIRSGIGGYEPYLGVL